MSGRYVVWLASGGFTHMLCTLSATMRYAQQTSRLILPFTDNQDSLQVSFYDFFSLHDFDKSKSSLFVGPDDYLSAVQGFEPPYSFLPSHLASYIIGPERHDHQGATYHLLQGVDHHSYNTRYLDYQYSDHKYEVTWGHFPEYWSTQLTEVFSCVKLHPRISRHVRTWFDHVRGVIGDQYTAVHYRNTDYKSDIYDTIDRLRKILVTAATNKVYWSSDDAQSFRAANRLLGAGYLFRQVPMFDVNSIPGAACLHNDGIPESYLRKQGTVRPMITVEFLKDLSVISAAASIVFSKGTVPFLCHSLLSGNGVYRDLFFGLL